MLILLGLDLKQQFTPSGCDGGLVYTNRCHEMCPKQAAVEITLPERRSITWSVFNLRLLECCVLSTGAGHLLLVIRKLKRKIGVVNVTKHDSGPQRGNFPSRTKSQHVDKRRRLLPVGCKEKQTISPLKASQFTGRLVLKGPSQPLVQMEVMPLNGLHEFISNGMAGQVKALNTQLPPFMYQMTM